MYAAGIDLNPAPIFEKVEFPVSVGTKSLAPIVRWEHGESWRTGLEDKFTHFASVRDLQISLNDPEYRDCINHQLYDRVVMPISSILVCISQVLNNFLRVMLFSFSVSRL